MSQRKLHKVASSDVLREWASSCPDATFTGTARVETQHATYLFRNGSCFAVSGRGPRGGTSTDLVGMAITGWVLPDDDPTADAEARRQVAAGGIRVSRNFRPGARAVLYGTAAGIPDGMRLALTSPVKAFSLFADGSVEERRPPTFDRSPTGSQTRIGFPLPA